MNRRGWFTVAIGAISMGIFGRNILAGGGMDRKPVIPQQVIDYYRLKPNMGGFWVLGEDGNPYNIDDAFSTLFEMSGHIWKRYPRIPIKRR